MDLNGIAAIITATGGALATVLTQILTWHSNQMKLREARDEIEALKVDHQRSARDLGQKTRDLEDQLSTIDDRTQSTQRLTEGIALATGNTPLPVPVRAPPPPSIPSGSQPGYKRP